MSSFCFPKNKKSQDDKQVYTVLQPDLYIVCDLSKIDARGCIGAPDLIIEIISPKNPKRDLKDKFEMTKPAGAFYAFIKAPTKTSAEFVEKAIKNNVLIIPGNVFSERNTHFRLCFTTKDETLLRGVEILNRLADELWG